MKLDFENFDFGIGGARSQASRTRTPKGWIVVWKGQMVYVDDPKGEWGKPDPCPETPEQHKTRLLLEGQL